MGVHKSPTDSIAGSDVSRLLRDLARLAVGTMSATTEPSAGDLLDLLLKASLAQRGALVLTNGPTSIPSLQLITGAVRWGELERVLALVAMDEAELTRLLSGRQSDHGHASSAVLVWALPLGTTMQRSESMTGGIPASGGISRVTILLGWGAGAEARAHLAAARHWLPEVADAVLGVVGALLTRERVAELETATVAQAAWLRRIDAARLDWQQALDAISDPISVVTPDYRVVRANAAYRALFGHDPAPRSAHRCFALLNGEGEPGQPCGDCPLPDTLATGRAGFAQRERLVPTGPQGTLQRRIYQTWTYPARNADGIIDHVVEILKDVTEQEQLRAALSQAEALTAADRLKAELLGTVSHELRNPLAAIKGYANTLVRHERRLPRAERHEFLRAIQEASDRLEVIIDRLLEMSQLETGTTTVHHVPVDVPRLIHEALTTIKAVQRAHSSEESRFRVMLTDGAGEPVTTVPLVAGDPRLLRVVLDNLLDNAVKYSPQGGDITITLAPITRGQLAVLAPPDHDMARTAPGNDGDAQGTADQEPMLDICVRDQGMGIPHAHLGRIFERFHRVDTRLTRDVDGLGLGLAMCKRIVELHAGAIWAESQPGEGSAFHVVLPLSQPHSPDMSMEEI